MIKEPIEIDVGGSATVWLSETATESQHQPIQVFTEYSLAAETTEALYQIAKRLMDICLVLLGIIALLPIMAVVAVTIKVSDGGPILFQQTRVGKRGRTFKFYKFRSMVVGADAKKAELASQNCHADPRTFKMENDPRITSIGRIIRKYSIDELPQLWNVLKGDMSIVGPRPPVPEEVALYSARDWQRLSVRPGLTCLWQVSGRSRLPFPQQVHLDLQYIRDQSLWLDVVLILRTIPAVLLCRGAA
jgi:exopolysaccharide biosynthesis polyprenyl glycosylphosphotransferase